MSQRAQQKATSRDAILESAAGCLRTRGVRGTSVQSAMAGAGLTVGAFYAHFADKNELLEAALAVALEDSGARAAEVTKGQCGLRALKAVSDRYLSAEHRDEPAAGCPLPAVLGEAAVSDAGLSGAALARALETMQQRISGIAGGAVSDQRALALVALMVGGQVLARATRGTPVSERALAACRAATHELAGCDR